MAVGVALLVVLLVLTAIDVVLYVRVGKRLSALEGVLSRQDHVEAIVARHLESHSEVEENVQAVAAALAMEDKEPPEGGTPLN
jgi:hypothetical protein